MKEFYVYLFHHIDVDSFIMPVEKFFELHPEYQYDDYLEVVTNKFVEAGWEGDGEMGIIWIPPFMNGIDDDCGNCVFHVKQVNNGTSFLASEYELPDFCERFIPKVKNESPLNKFIELTGVCLN